MSKLGLKLAILVSSCLFLTACGNQNQKPDAAAQKAAQKGSLGQTAFPQPFFSTASSQKSSQDNQQIQLHFISQSLAKNYKGLFKVNYQANRQTITLKPLNRDVLKIIKYAKKKNPSAIKSWHQFAHGVVATSQSVSKSAQDPNAKLAIVDPQNEQKEIYIAQNGKLIFDKFK